MAPRLSRSLISFLAFAAFGCAHAAELGEPRVGSHLGQPLVADIELTALEDLAAPVQVRLASADVYRGANLSMPPVLSSLSMSVMRRDGRQFLHITSLRPVEAEHLHLYLELADGAHRSVRLATLWLTADPSPAPEPVRAPQPAPERVVVPPPVLAVAPPPAPKLVSRPPAARAERPAACIPQVQAAAPENAVCVALDQKNAQLKSHLVGLEGKVKVLQVAMGGEAPAVVAEPKLATTAVAPAPRKPKQAPEPDTGLPWLWLGAGLAALLALAAAIVFGVRRINARKARAPAPVDPAIMSGVKSRLMPR